MNNKVKLAGILGLFLMLITPFTMAVGTGVSVGIGVQPGNLKPDIYMNPANRVLRDMNGAITRSGNYIFTGESLTWQVLVRDGNGIEDIESVVGTVGPTSGTGNPVEVGCVIDSTQPNNGAVINWAGNLVVDRTIDRRYTCQLTAEPTMHGEYYAQVVVSDGIDQASFKENSFFYFNPALSLEILNANSGIQFGTIEPGKTGYSQTIGIRNVAEAGAGVIMNITISGTDFYDPASSAARCPTTNALALSNIRYYATKGSYSSNTNTGIDTEGYDSIPYETGSPGNRAMIIDASSTLNPSAEFSLTFKLNMPKPCNGNFLDGSINFWGSAI